MKKAISILLSLLFVINLFSLNSFAANNNISSENFFLQIKELAYKYDDSSVLADEGIERVITNRLIVKTKTNTQLSNSYYATVVIEGFNNLHILQFLTAEQTSYAYSKLTALDEVEYVEYDFYFEITSDNASEESLHTNIAWNSNNANVTKAFSYLTDLGVKCFETNVAILDTGIHSQHSHFDNNIKKRIVNSQYMHKVLSVDSDGNDYYISYPSIEDDFFHGTSVAGVIFDNTVDNVKIIPYRISNSLEVLYSDILGALDKMLKTKIDVVNLSLAMPIYIYGTCNTMRNYIEEALAKGIVVVVASGNIKRSSLSNTSQFFPACMTNVITVAATNENNLPTSFSTYGDSVDIAAPGENIWCPCPRLETEIGPEFVPADNDYMSASGTSYAAPLVAAAAAMLKSIYPDISPALVEEIIKESAYVPDNWAESCGEKNYGVGIIDFYNMLMVAKEKMKPQIFFNSANKFEIKSLEPSHTIYYTLDGSEPTPENGVLYTEPLDLSKKVINVIKAASFMGDAQVGETTVYRMTSFKDMKINRGETEKAVSDSYRGKIRWRSDNLAVATVDSEGNVTGVSEGKTNVVATLESGKRIIFNVTVKEQPLYWLIELFEFWLSLFGINI